MSIKKRVSHLIRELDGNINFNIKGEFESLFIVISDLDFSHQKKIFEKTINHYIYIINQVDLISCDVKKVTKDFDIIKECYSGYENKVMKDKEFTADEEANWIVKDLMLKLGKHHNVYPININHLIKYSFSHAVTEEFYIDILKRIIFNLAIISKVVC
ncbi:MAG: hypothetical protein R3Y13_01555 [bacterium]